MIKKKLLTFNFVIIIIQIILGLSLNLQNLLNFKVSFLEVVPLEPYTYGWGMYAKVPAEINTITVIFENNIEVEINAEKYLGYLKGNMLYVEEVRLELCSKIVGARTILLSTPPIQDRITLCP